MVTDFYKKIFEESYLGIIERIEKEFEIELI